MIIDVSGFGLADRAGVANALGATPAGELAMGIHRFVFAVLTMLLLLAGAPPLASAQESDVSTNAKTVNVELIIDASGSMADVEKAQLVELIGPRRRRPCRAGRARRCRPAQ